MVDEEEDEELEADEVCPVFLNSGEKPEIHIT